MSNFPDVTSSQLPMVDTFGYKEETFHNEGSKRGCPEKLCISHQGKHSKSGWMQLRAPYLVKGALQPSTTKTLPRKSHTEMVYEAMAGTEQSFTLPIATRSEAEIIHTVKQRRVAHHSDWKLERAC